MKTLLIAALALLLATSPGWSQQKPAEPQLSPEQEEAQMTKMIESFGWTRKGKGRLGTEAQIEIPAGFRFTAKGGTEKMLKMTGNIPGGKELGVIAPEDLGWWVLFEYESAGYVKDTDKDKLDAEAILKDLKAGQEQANEARKEQGLDQLFLDGWAIPPRYNDTTHNLEWAIKVRSAEGGTSINYLTKLLGRRGVMHVTLLVSPEKLQATLPVYQHLLQGYGYNKGESYAEYRQGDKVAQYTLAGLITAGAGVALLKSGWLAKIGILFAKFAKPIIAGAIVLAASLRNVIARLFGRGGND